MKASAKGHLEVIKALAGTHGADVNVKNAVSCVHLPEIRLLLGWCMAGLYRQLVYYHCDDGGVLSVSIVFGDYTYGLVCGCVASALSIAAVRCASESGVHQGSMCSESGYMCGVVE